MRNCGFACATIIYATLSFIIVDVSSSVICPSVFEKGIPFDVYGGPLFPVSTYDKDAKKFITPLFVELYAPLAKGLMAELKKSNASICLHDEHPYCEFGFQNITQTMLDLLYQNKEFIPRINMWGTFRIDFWGVAALDDIKLTEVLLQRRTIMVACLHWCHAMLAMPESERPMMSYLCPNPCKQPGLCMSAVDEQGSCYLTGEGFFQHQYACKCKPGGTWNAAIGACVSDADPCENKKNPPCFAEGTEICTFDRESGVSSVELLHVQVQLFEPSSDAIK
ncbi:unnamed protein product [Rodentolepis nana]|uniref:Sushi domain-containing protein n=1 Tax=Rodentolepis nana TaxID=102285 RepID=A0A0R3TBQ5_RODNA|nr:unnamed protein product [Rodentolepis nana]